MSYIARKKIPSFSKSLKKRSRTALCRAADWLVVNQVRNTWPAWDANTGRFPYHILIDPVKRSKKPQVLSTCWKTSRTIQGLYSAYSVTGKEKYLDAAETGLCYIKSLQYFDPAFPAYLLSPERVALS